MTKQSTLIAALLLLSLPAFSSVKVLNKGTDRRPIFIGANKSHAPQEIIFNLKKLVNLKSSHKYTTVRVVIPPKSRKEIVRLWPSQSKAKTSWSYSFNTYTGNPSATPSNFTYSIPFQSVSAYRVSQSFGGQSTHNNSYSYYAVDIAMPIGTLIVAARGGKVIAIEQGNILSGKRKDLLDKANYIRVLHNDGTFADYAHLRWASIRPRLGSNVKRGQIIGQSGNVGYSSGPHLHFVLHKNFGGSVRSIPFKFTSGKPYKEQILGPTKVAIKQAEKASEGYAEIRWSDQ